jgi:hypothetical protein
MGLDSMTRGRTIGWALCGLLLGVLLGFAAELLRRQPAGKVQQRYVAPPASETTEASAGAPGVWSDADPGEVAHQPRPQDVPAGAGPGRQAR